MTTKHSTIQISALCSLVLLAASSFGQSPEDISTKAIPLQSLTRYKAQLDFSVMTMIKGAETNITTHSVQYGLKTNGSFRQRTETDVSLSGIQSESLTIIVDSNIFQVFPGQKRVLEISAGGVANPYATNLAGIFANPANFTFELRRDKLDGRNVNVVVMTMRKPALQQQEKMVEELDLKAPVPVITKQEKWVDVENNIILQLLTYNKNGHLISGIKYSNIQTNVELPQSLFEIPADYTHVTVNNNDAIKEIVKTTIATISKQGFKPSLNEPIETQHSRNRIGYAFLVFFILQGGGLLVWSIIRRRKNG